MLNFVVAFITMGKAFVHHESDVDIRIHSIPNFGCKEELVP